LKRTTRPTEASDAVTGARFGEGHRDETGLTGVPYFPWRPRMVLQIGRGRHRPRPKLSSWAGPFDDGQEKPRPMGIKGRGRSGVSIPVNGNALSQNPTEAVAVGNTLIYGLLQRSGLGCAARNFSRPNDRNEQARRQGPLCR
jgi:hypothetical protein